MTSRLLSSSTILLLGAALYALPAPAQSQAAQPASPYGGVVVDQIIARVNDRIITQTDYDRALQELTAEDRSRGDSMQQMADARRNLLRDMIDQQLWLSKGKELGITGDTELIKRLDEIRKQYHMASLEDLQKAAESQGVSYADFKQNIRNQVITQDVMRQEVGSRIQITRGQAEHYYEEHSQDYKQPESVSLSEILISTGKPEANGDPDPAKVAAAKAQAEDIEARLHAGGDFAELARRFSNGQTASSGGELGQFHRGDLAKVLEEKTFPLKAGQWTDPILTRQGWVILKVTQHTPAGIQPFNQVEDQVDQALYMSLMGPAIRSYLTKMREQAYIDIKPGFEDTGASPNETKPSFSAYVPPQPKKRRRVERVRFREKTRDFRHKDRKAKAEKPGKREKIRYGQAPMETLPSAIDESTNTVDAGALPESASSALPPNPLEPVEVHKKVRFSDLGRERREKKKKKRKHESVQPAANPLTPPPPSAAEVAARQIQSAPLGLNGDTAKKKKKKKSASSTGEKTRYSNVERNAEKQPKPAPQITIPAPVAGAPAPAQHQQAPQQ